MKFKDSEAYKIIGDNPVFYTKDDPDKFNNLNIIFEAVTRITTPKTIRHRIELVTENPKDDRNKFQTWEWKDWGSHPRAISLHYTNEDFDSLIDVLYGDGNNPSLAEALSLVTARDNY